MKVGCGLTCVVWLGASPLGGQTSQDTTHRHETVGHEEHAGMEHGAGANRMPPMPKGMAMPLIQGMQGVAPRRIPFLPGTGIDPASLPLATPRRLVEVRSGDSLELTAMLVRRRLLGRDHVMYGFNGQYPGPLIRVRQDATITVKFHNRLDLPSSVHWHGIRLDNQFDGAVGVTQEAVPVGGDFVYRIHFPDAGIYWYHPHVREDIQQDLGLYGNLLVDSPDPNYYSLVNQEDVLMLDDILLDDEGLLPFGQDVTDFAIMGRFGNLLLVNGEPHYQLTVNRGDVVRFLLTNVANTRTFNLSFPGAPMKLVGADISKFIDEVMVSTVVIAAAQRYVVEARFDSVGTFPITNQVQALNNFLGQFVPTVDTLGMITVRPERSKADHETSFKTLRHNADVATSVDPYRKYFAKAVDKDLLLSVKIAGMPIPITAFMAVDTMYFPPQEWVDGMRDMNWVSTSREVHWLIREVASGKENMDIPWTMHRGDVMKVRITNDPTSVHPMSHPIHFHGQRLLIVSRDGIPEEDLAWRDTILVPVGQSVEILVEATNPGKWMMHCHIAEHLEAGMHLVFTVEP